MSKKLYRINELASTKGSQGVLPISAATVWRLLKGGNFPKPFRISNMSTVWDSDDIDKWIDEQKALGYTKHPNTSVKPEE